MLTVAKQLAATTKPSVALEWCHSELSEGVAVTMKSVLFKDFGIPEVECQLHAAPDPWNERRIWFKAAGYPLVGLGLQAAEELQSALARAGDIAGAGEIERCILRYTP